MAQATEPEIGRLLPRCFANWSETRTGKTRTVIEAAQRLFERREIDRVIVVAPASVRDGVWFDPDPDVGQLARYLRVPALVTRFHARKATWGRDSISRERSLRWLVTNYEFVRVPARLAELLQIADERTVLVLDEAHAVKNHRAAQTKACAKLRARCGWIWQLTATPTTDDGIGDIYAQAAILDRRIIGVKNFWEYRARYAILGGFKGKEIVGWRHALKRGCCERPATSAVHGPGAQADEVQTALSSYVVRRLKAECLDLPPKLDPVTLTVALGKESWALYRQMRDDAVAWLDANASASAAVAGARVMRLAQITSGHVGGVKALLPCGCGEFGADCPRCGGTGGVEEHAAPRDVGREKLDFLIEWLAATWREEPAAKIIVWSRWRREVERAYQELWRTSEFIPPSVISRSISRLWGGQPAEERAAALRLLHPQTAPPGPAVVIGHPRVGGAGLDFAAASWVLRLSSDHNLADRIQSDDRPHGPGQTRSIWYGDVVATGPNGEPTVDRTILLSLRRKLRGAEWTARAWLAALQEEQRA